MISFSSRGDFSNTERFLAWLKKGEIMTKLEGYGREGVEALKAATPWESGTTAEGWYFKVTYGKGQWSITWYNNHVNDGVPIAIILQYGHGTGTGGYVQGRDYINPAMRPIFNSIADKVWKVVTSK